MKVHLSGDVVEKMEQVITAFGKQGKVAVARAINRAVAGVKTDSSQEVRKRYPGAKAGAIKKTFSTKRANASTLMGMARSRGGRQPLFLFGARPNTPEGRRPPIGASVRITRRKRIPGAFVAKMSNGHLGLFIRSGEYGRNKDPKQERIQELYTFAVPQAVEWIEQSQGAISKGAQQRFTKNLDHEMGRILKQLGAR